MQQSDLLRVLMDASSILLRKRSVSAVLVEVLDLAKQVIAADAYAVWRTYDAGKSWQMLASQGLSESYREEHRTVSGPVPATPLMIADVEEHPLSIPFKTLYAREGIRSLSILPMRVEEQGIGTITFYYRKAHVSTELDLRYGAVFTNLAAAALRTSELHEENQLEKKRLSFLAEASTVLASSLDYESTLERVAHLAVLHIADWCTVHVLEDGKPMRLVVAHADPAKIQMARDWAARYPERMREDRGLGKVLRTGVAELHSDIPDNALAEAAQDEEHLRVIRGLGIKSVILVPLQARGRVLGAIQLISASAGHRYDQEDLQLAQDLATRAAVAMDHALVHRELVENERRLRLSHATGKMGSWTMDLAKGRIYWSEEFKSLHGMAADANPSFELGAGLIHPEDRESVTRELAAVLASNADELSFEHRAIAHDGRLLWVHSRGHIERDADGKATSVRGITIDLTERRQTEEVLKRTEKLAAAGRLAATVAHEINNPLEAVTNLVYLARGAPELPADASHHLTLAEEELERIAQIVRQTLGFYRESASPRRTNLSRLVESTLNLYRRKIQIKEVKLMEDIEAEVWATIVGGEIQQAIANLLSNATDATASGGLIAISLRGNADAVEIIVRDTGPGIPEELRGRIFEPFFSTKKDVGTGLGLWVTQGIVQKHGGTVEVRSAEDRERHGSEFVIRFPRDGVLRGSETAAAVHDDAIF